MIKSLRKIDFSHHTGHYTWEKNRAPLEKILGAPLQGPYEYQWPSVHQGPSDSQLSGPSDNQGPLL